MLYKEKILLISLTCRNEVVPVDIGEKHTTSGLWLFWAGCRHIWISSPTSSSVKYKKNLYTVILNVLKFQTLFYFCIQIKCLVTGLEFTKCLSEQQTGKTLIRLLVRKQSDLGLHCLQIDLFGMFGSSLIWVCTVCK